MEEEIKVTKINFIEAHLTKVTDDYRIIKQLGDGVSGAVFLAAKKTTEEKCAIKQILKARLRKGISRARQEIDILKTLDHPNIIRLHEVYEDHTSFYLVTELCQGGELFEAIAGQNLVSEAQANSIFKQIAVAIQHMHSKELCHRDLKPENILLTDTSIDSQAKLIDFGLAKNWKLEAKDMNTKAGSCYYVAPEVLEGSYDYRCDIWSLGVILYILLVGYPPFNGPSNATIFQSIKRDQAKFRAEDWNDISQEAQDLARRMLVKNPEERITLTEILNHPWLNEARQSELTTPIDTANLQRFAAHQQIKKAIIMIIARQMNENEIQNLQEQFLQLDPKMHGEITPAEFRQTLQESGIDSPEISEAWDALDVDRTGKVGYNQYIAASLTSNVYMQEEKLMQAFNVIDADHSGKISNTELKSVLTGSESPMKGSTIYDSIINEVDRNGDGQIDFSEFCEMMRNLRST